MVSTAFLAGCQNDTQRHEDNAQEIVVPENETAGPIGGDTLVTVRYRCDDKKSVTARYINSQKPEDTFVILSIDGPSTLLYSVTAASGAKYATEQGLKPDHTLIWWTKGDEGMMYESPLDDSVKPGDEQLITTCRTAFGPGETAGEAQ
jgi:membrane-bound inhibitor of C-type lysozyme